MEWLNYHHLFYFWTVVREGTVAAAGQRLSVSQSSISTQIRTLETALGVKLFRRRGRKLEPTEAGQAVFRYANAIFGLGRELLEEVKGRSVRPPRLHVGAHDTLPKLVAYRLLEPVLQRCGPIQLACYEGTPEQLLPRLSVNEVDLVLSDAPISPTIKVRAFNHLLGECGIRLFAVRELARKLRRGFPKSLHEAPALLPSESTAMRWTLERWFESIGVRPRVMAEFEDIELMMTFGRQGHGFFPAHDVIAQEMLATGEVENVGAVPGRNEKFYAISVERRPTHPAVVALTDAAHELLSQRK
jgi:LysR family transcriptional activator of nhaA